MLLSLHLGGNIRTTHVALAGMAKYHIRNWSLRNTKSKRIVALAYMYGVAAGYQFLSEEKVGIKMRAWHGLNQNLLAGVMMR